MPAVRFCTRRVCEQTADAQKLGDSQRSADFQTFHRFFYGHGVSEGNPPFLHDTGESGCCLLLKCIDLLEVSHGF